MMYLGDFAEDETVYVTFNTFTSDDPSASATITNLANTDIHIHKDGSVTQKTTANGVTVSIDFDGITGNHLVQIDTSNDTGDAGFWVTGSDYLVRMEGTTVDGATINAWIGQFSIQNRYMRGTDSAYTGTPPTAAAIADAVWDEPQADHLGAGSMGDQLDDLETAIAGLNDVSQAEVNAEVDTAFTDYDPPTKAELDSGLAGLNDLSAAQVNAEVVDALNVDTYAEPGQGAPGATISLAGKINYLYKWMRNRSTQTATTMSIYDDAGTTVDQKRTVSDDGTTAEKGEITTGP